jgi:beta-mannanase
VDTLEQRLGRPLDIVNTYRRFDQLVGTSSDQEFLSDGATLMVSWATGDNRSILAGVHDRLIRAQAEAIRKVGKPVLLRIRWEMDRPNLRATMWSAEDYIAAYKYIRDIFADEHVTNVSWVWCPTAEGFQRGDAPAFYPGDDSVDWTCVDVYAGNLFQPIGQLMGPYLRWAAQRPKPIIIGEFGVAKAWGSAGRAAWLRDARRTFKANPQIKAVVYFESDPEGNGPNQQFQLTGDKPAFSAFTSLTRDPYFNPG